MSWVGRGYPCLLFLGICAECSNGASEHPTCSDEGLIYGSDDRQDLFEAPEFWRDVASSSVLGLVPTDYYESIAKHTVSPSDLSAQSVFLICSDERFSDQPALAQCTGVLVAPDLVLTAGHCFLANDTCDRYVYALGLGIHDDSGQLTIDDDNVYRCAEIVERVGTPGSDELEADYALVRLKRKVAGQPARLSQTTPSVGERLTAISHPIGLPLKVDSGAHVIALLDRPSPGEFFAADIDSSVGSSGAPVFDADGELVGMLSSGGPDFNYNEQLDCFHSRTTDAGYPSAYETVMSVPQWSKAVCATHPDLPFCSQQIGRPRPYRCGELPSSTEP